MPIFTFWALLSWRQGKGLVRLWFIHVVMCVRAAPTTGSFVSSVFCCQDMVERGLLDEQDVIACKFQSVVEGLLCFLTSAFSWKWFKRNLRSWCALDTPLKFLFGLLIPRLCVPIVLTRHILSATMVVSVPPGVICLNMAAFDKHISWEFLILTVMLELFCYILHAFSTLWEYCLMFFCLGFSLVQDLTYMSVSVCVCVGLNCAMILNCQWNSSICLFVILLALVIFTNSVLHCSCMYDFFIWYLFSNIDRFYFTDASVNKQSFCSCLWVDPCVCCPFSFSCVCMFMCITLPTNPKIVC